jgi:hypothetical protein
MKSKSSPRPAPPRRETRTRPTKAGIYECVFWGEDGANGVLGFSPRVDSCDEIVTNDDDTPSLPLARNTSIVGFFAGNLLE